MAGHYNKKQHDRLMKLYSEEDSYEIDDRQLKRRGKSKFELLYEDMYDFHPDDSRNSIPCPNIPSLTPAISVCSDDGVNDYNEFLARRTAQENRNATNISFSAIPMRTSTNEVADIVNLAQWITTDRELSVAPLYRRYKNPFSMRDKCRRAEPVVDNTMLHDLQRIFCDLSLLDLPNLVRSCQKLPYWVRSADGSLNERAKEFMSGHNLTEEQLIRVNEIGKKILLRSSYGVLFLQENKFFAKANPNHRQRRSAIKGYPLLKPTGECEHLWETAVRITERDVQYFNRQVEQWQLFNMNEHTTENERQNYLECLITGERDREVVRYIGLFVIRLRPNIQIRTNDYNQVDINQNWYLIDEEVDNGIFYTIRPFLRYLLEHRDFV